MRQNIGLYLVDIVLSIFSYDTSCQSKLMLFIGISKGHLSLFHYSIDMRTDGRKGNL